MPIIAIYFLGFRLDKSLPKVTKIRRVYLDGISGEALGAEVKNEFIENLTHDAVVVQIPAKSDPQLQDKGSNNPLELALELFNQTYRTSDQHFLAVESETLADAPAWLKEMFRILEIAAADEETRAQMEVEDDVYSMVDRVEAAELAVRDMEANAKEMEVNLKEMAANAKDMEANLKEMEAAAKEATAAIEELRKLKDDERALADEERRLKEAALEELQKLRRRIGE